MFYTVRIPSWFIRLNASMLWRITTTEKELYLTFDDGPHETATPFVLDQLKHYNAKASFFCIGKNVKSHPHIYKRILDEGHAVGNHTFNHLNGWKTKNDAYIKDVAEASAYIHSNLFRPPYGRISPFAAKQLRKNLHFNIIMWHILSGDFDKNISPQKCAENVLLFSKPGSIIVFHDSIKGWEKMSYALPRILEKFTQQGFSFKALKLKKRLR
jgi:peptidoglycan/xylan/chitin deacetylase (PgdA/CDA1 family)